MVERQTLLLLDCMTSAILSPSTNHILQPQPPPPIFPTSHTSKERVESERGRRIGVGTVAKQTRREEEEQVTTGQREAQDSNPAQKTPGLTLNQVLKALFEVGN